MRWWPKTLKSKLNLKGNYQAQVHSGQIVLVVDRQGGWTALTVAKDAQGRVRHDSRKPRDLHVSRHSNSLKKSQFTLSQGC
jgi:hypothetical protein